MMKAANVRLAAGYNTLASKGVRLNLSYLWQYMSILRRINNSRPLYHTVFRHYLLRHRRIQRGGELQAIYIRIQQHKARIHYYAAFKILFLKQHVRSAY